MYLCLLCLYSFQTLWWVKNSDILIMFSVLIGRPTAEEWQQNTSPMAG